MSDYTILFLFFLAGVVVGVVMTMLTSKRFLFTITATNSCEYERQVVNKVHQLNKKQTGAKV